LGETILLFVFPHPVPRLWHTFFCPSLRIIALDDDGEIRFDQVKPPGQFVQLPASRRIIETDPDQELSPESLQELARNAPDIRSAVGTWDGDAAIDRLWFALVKEAVADMRRVHSSPYP
jgi:hypothetical protein